MGQHINLIYKKKKYQERERKFALFRRFTVFVGILVVVFSSLFFFIGRQREDEYGRVLREKESHLQALVKHPDLAKKISYLDKKGGFIREALARDARFPEYYKILSQYFPTSTASGEVVSLSIDNERNLQMEMTFITYQDFSTALSKIEQEDFQELFESLELEKANIRSVKDQESFRLAISGVLDKLNAL